MEIKRPVLIVAIVLEAFFATLSNGLCEYTYSEHLCIEEIFICEFPTKRFICMLSVDCSPLP